MNKIEKTLTSMEVAEMVEKVHNKLLRDIREYCSQLSQSKIGQSDFFTASTYTNSRGKTYSCYLVTKKGCEFIANKLTGIKGTAFTARYINRFHEMEEIIENTAIMVESRVLTKDDYIKAASMVSSCRNERLPYVLGLLEQAGFIVPGMGGAQEPIQQSEVDTDLMELLNQYSMAELVNRLHICRTSLYYYRIGKTRPQGERLKYIIEALG